MTQFEQENDFGRGGGEVDEETMEKAERTAAERRNTANVEEDRAEDEVVPVAEDEENPQPWAKLSSGRGPDEG